MEAAGGDVALLELKKVQRAVCLTSFQLLNRTVDTRLLYDRHFCWSFRRLLQPKCRKISGDGPAEGP